MKLALPLAFLFAASIARAAPAPDADGFVPLFNGRDLTGWANVNCAPETWSVRDNMIVCSGQPIGALRTTRQYENFIAEFEWRHLKSGGNSGMFVWASPIGATGVPFLRGIEVQALDHGYAEEFERQNRKKADWFTVHGDVFPIHGATMTTIGRTNGKRSFPTEERSKRSPEWNHYRIVANNGTLRLHVNGKEVSGGDDCNYRKGYLALESEGSPVEFRNLRIKELPSTGAGPDVSAPEDLGWKSLFNGVDLRGWRTSATTALWWEISREKIFLRPGSRVASADDAPLWTTAEFGDAEFVIDFQALATPRGPGGSVSSTATVLLRGQNGKGTPLELPAAQAGKFSRFVITIRGRTIQVQRDDGLRAEAELPADAPARGAFGLSRGAIAGLFMNLYAREL